jgi:hypothetical protein
MLTSDTVDTLQGESNRMSKRTISGLLALALIFSTAAVRAELRTIDTVPAATLLLPYFEVDLADPLGVTTILWIVNSGSFATPPDTVPSNGSAALAHVTMWTDLGIPTLDFDIYLTGYDVVAINLRDVFNGFLPGTAPPAQDPGDVISPQGPLSEDLNFPGCAGLLPYPSPALSGIFLTRVRNAHTGKSSLGNLCVARDLGDDVARGFVTIDSVSTCSLEFPTSPGYFASIANTRNVLAGDFLYVDPANNFAQGETLVPIQADPSASEFVSGDYTFYGALVGGDASDAREPLATAWAVPFQDRPLYNVVTDLIVWRDPIVQPVPFGCGDPLPAPFPIGTKQLVGFDVEENPALIAGTPAPFPVVAMRTRINGPAPAPSVGPRAGWLFLNLNSPADVAASPFSDKTRRQSWVMVIKQGSGLYSTGHAAIQLDNAADAAP